MDQPYSSSADILLQADLASRTVEYAYDPLGRRVVKQVDGVTVEKYLWAGMADLVAGLSRFSGNWTLADFSKPLR